MPSDQRFAGGSPCRLAWEGRGGVVSPAYGRRDHNPSKRQAAVASGGAMAFDEVLEAREQTGAGPRLGQSALERQEPVVVETANEHASRRDMSTASGGLGSRARCAASAKPWASGRCPSSSTTSGRTRAAADGTSRRVAAVGRSGSRQCARQAAERPGGGATHARHSPREGIVGAGSAGDRSHSTRSRPCSRAGSPLTAPRAAGLR